VRKLYFPRGDYRIDGTLRMPSGTHVEADAEARVFSIAGNRANELVTNADWKEGNRDIAIRGGRWDGNCGERDENSFDPEKGYGGRFFHFVNLKGLHVSDLEAFDSVTYHFSLARVTDFRFANLRIGGDRRPMCQDGIHVGGGCERGQIHNLIAHAGGMGDDLIALNADDVFHYVWNDQQQALPIRDITVENIDAPDCFTVVRLLTVDQPIERCTFRNIRAGFRIHGLNLDAARYCMHPMFHDQDRPHGVGALRDILFENIDLWNTGGNPERARELVTYESNGTNVVFRNMRHRCDLAESPAEKRQPLVRFRHLAATSLLVDGVRRELGEGEIFTLEQKRVDELRIDRKPTGDGPGGRPERDPAHADSRRTIRRASR
jgi:hypothetical protein